MKSRSDSPLSGTLVIADAGHSRVKLHSYSLGRRVNRLVLRPGVLAWPSARFFFRATETLLLGTDPGCLRLLRRLISAAGLPRPRLLCGDLPIPVKSLCSARTGNDRLAQALGASQLFPGKSCIIVGAGSALVIDFLDRKGVFHGGLIGLGFSRYEQAMAGISPLLEVRKKTRVSWPAKDTSEAVFLGWTEPAVAAILALQEKKQADKVILSGGDAGLLASHIPGAETIPYLGPDAVARALGYPC